MGHALQGSRVELLLTVAVEEQISLGRVEGEGTTTGTPPTMDKCAECRRGPGPLRKHARANSTRRAMRRTLGTAMSRSAPGSGSGSPQRVVRSLGAQVTDRVGNISRLERETLFSERGACEVRTKYDPEELVRRRLKDPVDAAKLAIRGLDIVFSLGKFFASLKLDELLGNSSNATVRSRAAELRETLTYLGPSFIKAGQLLANRPDVVRADYMEELCVLQDDVPSFPDEEAFEIIEDDGLAGFGFQDLGVRIADRRWR